MQYIYSTSGEGKLRSRRTVGLPHASNYILVPLRSPLTVSTKSQTFLFHSLEVLPKEGS